MRLKHTVQVQLSQDADAKRKLYSDDATSAQTDTSGFEKQANSLLAIDPAGLEDLKFGDVTLVKGIYLEVNRDAIVRLNGGTEAIQLRKAPDASVAKLFLEADLTQVTVENPTSEALSGVYVVWGDPTT
jgi:hypothetical protein